MEKENRKTKDLSYDKRKQLIFEFMNQKEYEPLKLKDIGAVFQVPRKEKDDLRRILESLVEEGKIIIDARGRYSISAENIRIGEFSGTQRGFGFVIIEGEESDIFIPATATKGALHGDTVQVKISDTITGKRREGEVLSVIKRHKDVVVGVFQKSKNFGFVIPDNQKFGKDIFISKERTKGAVDGHKVVVRITNFGDQEKNPEGKVVQILGHMNDPGVDVMAIIIDKNLPLEYPPEVLRQIENIPEEVTSEDIIGRMDIRNLPTVTIDGEDAKDLDDAITLSKKNDMYTLGVHIADVTHYVTEGSPLDIEALNRGNSVYLVDRVIPMLPHKLSNGICSLNAGTDRLALSCFIDIDKTGTVIGHRIAETLINVDERMSYTSVSKILEEEDEAERKRYQSLIPMFEDMHELAVLLRKKRRKRGSIDFEFPESKIEVDQDGNVLDIKPYIRNQATKIIEDFMLIANETIAEDFFWQELPFVYRSHEKPDPEKIEKLGIFINNFGYTLKIGQEDIHPKELQKLLSKIEDTPEEPLISRLTLRAMKQARYTTTCDGHFGLSTRYYCHFTSPIRRYPDLQIHRIIKENLRAGISEKRENYYNRILLDVARQTSTTERRAEEAEREVEKLKKIEYMKQYIGEIFEGVISGVTSWGMYVELPNTVEGMIRVADMEDDYYVYDEERQVMIGEHTRKTYKLGEAIRIKVVAVDKLQRTIDFALADMEE